MSRLRSSSRPIGARAQRPTDDAGRYRRINDEIGGLFLLRAAERRVEPNLVLAAVAKFSQVPDFHGKAQVKADLEGRAHRQAEAFQQRDAGDTTADTLDGALDRVITDAEEALFVCEKRFEARFPRDAKYVASFFMEKPSRKKKKAPEPPTEPVAG